jgi:biotin-dependent carboxylase-like uncharacterized protein
MDPEGTAYANLLVGNAEGSAVVEWALGTGRVRCEETRAVAGFGATLRVRGTEVPPGTGIIAPAGSDIELGLPEGRFAGLAVAGGVASPPVLGSRSTYLVAGFGGHEGRRLRRGDRLPLGRSAFEPPAEHWGLPAETVPPTPTAIRIVPGPQSELFDDTAWVALTGARYAIAAASDRMGYRLEGPALVHRGAPDLPSEPVCPGAIQVPQGGAPIVLMPDGPTVGGYPKIAAIITADAGAFAQCAPGSRPRFILVTFDEAVAALRHVRERLRAARAFMASLV